MNQTEMLPQFWDAARDDAFFRITAPLFAAAFTAGATVLLASYDDEPAQLVDNPTPHTVPVPRRRISSNTWV